MTKNKLQKTITDLTANYKEAERNVREWTTRSIELRGAIVEMQKLLTSSREVKTTNAIPTKTA